MKTSFAPIAIKCGQQRFSQTDGDTVLSVEMNYWSIQMKTEDRFKDKLNDNHWRMLDYRERITTKQWRNILLNCDDILIFKGHLYRLGGKNLGAGVVEVYKKGLVSNEPTRR